MGVFFQTCGKSAGTGVRSIHKARIKIRETPLSGGGPKCATNMCNIYVTPAINWAIALCKTSLETLNGLDRELLKRLRYHNGLTRSDCAINVMRPVQSYGSGCKDFVETYLCGLAREMEELLSNPGDPGYAVRNSMGFVRESNAVQR